MTQFRLCSFPADRIKQPGDSSTSCRVASVVYSADFPRQLRTRAVIMSIFRKSVFSILIGTMLSCCAEADAGVASLSLSLQADGEHVDLYVRNVDPHGRDITLVHGIETSVLVGRTSLRFFDEQGECLQCQSIAREFSAGQTHLGFDDHLLINEIKGSTFPKWYIQEMFGLQSKCYHVFAQTKGDMHFNKSPAERLHVRLVSNVIRVCF